MMYIDTKLNVRAAIVDDSASGKMQPTTEVGIAIALFCFLVLLFGFYLVSRSRPPAAAPPPPQRTYANEQIALTYERWGKNMSGRGKSARQEQRQRDMTTHHHQQTSEYRGGGDLLPLYTLRPASTLSGVTVVDDEHQSNPEYTELPSLPSPAYFSHHQAESQDIFGGEHRRAL